MNSRRDPGHTGEPTLVRATSYPVQLENDERVGDAPMTLPSPEARSATTRVTRTFAFIDLCDFTDYGEAHGDDAAVAELLTLRASVRAAAPLFGVRVDKWLGDGVMLVGVESAPVVAAVMAICHRHAETGELAMRAGIAGGPVILLEGDDYVGHAVNTAARLSDRAQ